GEVADEKNRDMAQLLKRAQLANNDRVAQVDVRRGRVSAKLDAQGFSRRGRLFELRAQLVFANDLGGAFSKIGQLFVDSHSADRVAQLSKGALSSFRAYKNGNR